MKLRQIYLFIILFFSTQLSAQLFTFQNFNHRDGLNMGTISSLNQSTDGYIWIGTDGAELVRYNGKTFEEIRIPGIDNNYHVEDISFDGENVLFASRYKGFYKYSGKQNKITKLNENAPQVGEALAVYKKDSILYFIDTRGIRSQTGKKINKLLSLNSSQDNITINHTIETDNAIFLITNLGAYRLSHGNLMPIGKWLGVAIRQMNEFKYGFYEDKKLTLFNDQANRWLEIAINEKGAIKSISESKTPFILSEEEAAISFSYNSTSKSAAILTNTGRIYQLKNKIFTRLTHNYREPLEECHTILTDLNGDYWVASNLRGIYKISREPFTKLQQHPIYESPNINFPYRTLEGSIIISMYTGETHVGSLYDDKPFKVYNFVTKGIQEIDGTYYVASNTGVRVYNKSNRTNFDVAFFKNQNITFILADEKSLWVGVAGKGLHKINTITQEITDFEAEGISLPNYFYTGQINADRDKIFFGTNSGIFEYSKTEDKFSNLNFNPDELGYYSGVSTTDVYGTCWFTMERGIVGITKSNKQKVIKGDKYFRTTLFYTLNSDQFGNLIIGTNKGITMLKVDQNGKVVNSRYFDDKSGFKGYEMHMRSQFQNDHQIFVGTVEGLFLIDTKLIEEPQIPLAPIISLLTEEENDVHVKSGSHGFQFHVNNPKAGKIKYSYRIVGEGTGWITLEEDQDIIQINNLSTGNYMLEVRASYDNINFSESAFQPFNFNLPIWKTNWFILLLIGCVILFNAGLVYYYNFFEGGKLMNTKDLNVHLRMTPALLLFSAIVAPGALILGPVLDSQLKLHLGLAFTLAFVMITMYFMSLSAKSSKKEHLFSIYLRVGLFLIMAVYLWEVYTSRLHPYNIIGVALISVMVPYILGKIKATISFGFVIFTICLAFVVILDTTIYPKLYFMIAMFSMICLMIFSSYLRYDSLEKLIFISGIINKGNIPAIAFNKEGKITYSSENISNYANTTHDEIMNKNISILNNFIPFGNNYKKTDVTKEFQDGEKYLVPMEDTLGKVHWVEWAYRDFSREIKVILGQDVTEKMELESTYKLLVQNAEDFIYRCDITGNFLFLNDVCFSKLGFTKGELVGTNSLNIVCDEYKNRVERFYNDHFKGNKPSSYMEFPIHNKNGTVIWLGQHLTTLYFPGSSTQIEGFIALARDITELRAQQELIQEQQDAITSSISYARRIQYNLLPEEKQFNAAFEEHFVISKPKDIVSGDFYWMEKVGNYTVLVLADCTGHGVPGSFMSLLGNNLLNSIVLEGRIVNPAVILNELDTKLIKYLPKGAGENIVNDGMEVTICVFDDFSNEMSYACAGSRFLVYEKEAFTMFKGDNKHIGDLEDNFEGYNVHYTEFGANINLFLFTDGFQDQFGGPKDKKYSFRRLLELLDNNINLPLSEQKVMIESDFEKWIGNNQQTDDITIVSVKRKLVDYKSKK